MNEVNSNLENYVWKGPRIDGVQKEEKLVDCTVEKLLEYQEHCRQMLYNDNPKLPGRYTLVKIIENQIQCCRAELLVRWLRSEANYTYQHCYEDIRTLIKKNHEELTQEAIEQYPIGNLISEIPDEYKRVPIGLVLKASMYSLGVFKSYITLNFLAELGIYLTQQEMQQELLERDPVTGKARNRMEVIKERENLNPSFHLEYHPDGLSYAEFHAMYKLHSDKYEKLTSVQLKLLSEKILYRFQQRCEKQAEQWETKLKEISEVLKSKEQA